MRGASVRRGRVDVFRFFDCLPIAEDSDEEAYHFFAARKNSATSSKGRQANFRSSSAQSTSRRHCLAGVGSSSPERTSPPLPRP